MARAQCDKPLVMISKVFSLYKMDAWWCPQPATAHVSREKCICCCASNRHKKCGKFFQFFQKWWIFSQKCNKSQNIPNMKTKIFNYPSIVLATYGKPNSEIWRFSHFWQLKPWKNFQFQFLKYLFEKVGPKKKGLMQMKMHSYSPHATGFCLLGRAWRFLDAKNNFLQISRVTHLNTNKLTIIFIIVLTWLG